MLSVPTHSPPLQGIAPSTDATTPSSAQQAGERAPSAAPAVTVPAAPAASPLHQREEQRRQLVAERQWVQLSLARSWRAFIDQLQQAASFTPRETEAPRSGRARPSVRLEMYVLHTSNAQHLDQTAFSHVEDDEWPR